MGGVAGHNTICMYDYNMSRKHVVSSMSNVLTAGSIRSSTSLCKYIEKEVQYQKAQSVIPNSMETKSNYSSRQDDGIR